MLLFLLNIKIIFFRSSVWHSPCIQQGPFLFRLVSLSEGNCLIWHLLRISDSGSEIHVSVQPSDTLSHCKWKLCEMCLSQKHIPHKSSRSISRDACSDESWSRWEWESVSTACLYLKDCVQFSQSTAVEKASSARWTIVHCSGQCDAERTARSDALKWCTMPAAEQYRECMSGKVVTLHWILLIRVGKRGRVGR